MSARVLRELLDLNEGTEELDSSSEAEELESSPHAVKATVMNNAALRLNSFLNCIWFLLVQDIELLLGGESFTNHAKNVLAGGEGHSLKFEVSLLFAGEVAGGNC